MPQTIETANSVIRTDLQKVRRNIARIRNHIGPDVQIMYVAKSNGYGHGLFEPTFFMRDKCNIHYFATGMVSEAIDLRDAGLKDYLLIIGGINRSAIPAAVSYDLVPTIYETSIPALLSAEGRKVGKEIKVQIKIETGLNRLGVRPGEELGNLIETIKRLPNICVDGVFTHLAEDYTAKQPFTALQLSRFNEALDQLKKAGIKPRLISAAATGGCLHTPSSHYNMVRLAAMIFGYDITPDPPHNKLSLEPAMSWTTTVLSLRCVEAGERISYSPFVIPKRRTLVAILGFGMGDGYVHNLVTSDIEHNADVLINGKRARLLDLNMDQTFADVTDIPNIKIGDKVTIIGRDGEDEITTMELGRIGGTSSGHVCCSITGRPFRCCIY